MSTSTRRPLSRSQLRADSTSLAHRTARRYREDPSLPRLCEEFECDTPATHAWAEAGQFVSVAFLLCPTHAETPLDEPSLGRLIRI